MAEVSKQCSGVKVLKKKNQRVFRRGGVCRGLRCNIFCTSDCASSGWIIHQLEVHQLEVHQLEIHCLKVHQLKVHHLMVPLLEVHRLEVL